MPFNCEEREKVNSEGRRMFLVCKHHSNGFGIVFNDDRTSRAWNCASEQAGDHRREQVDLSKFRWNIKQGNFPFIYE